MKKNLISFIVTALLTGILINIHTTLNAAQQNQTLYKTILPDKKIKALLDQQYAEGIFPGAAVALQFPGKEISIFTSGSAELSEGFNILNPNQPLGIGSTTKTFVAVVVLQLVQSGELDLNQNIKKWFPNLPEASRITPRQLLQHTSGLNEYIESKKVLDDAKRFWPPEELVQVALENGKLCEPGEAYHYSNVNSILLGQLIEKITGRPWYIEVRERIIEPLGLKHTFYPGEISAQSAGPGYRKLNGRFIEQSDIYHISVGSSAEGLMSTAHDLLLFLRALMEGHLLDQKRKNEMFTFVPSETYDHIKSAYGLGIQRHSVNELVFYGHFGTSSAWSSFMGFEPESGLIVTVVLNFECVGKAPILGTEIIGLATGRDVAPPNLPTFSFSFEHYPYSLLADPDDQNTPGLDKLKIRVSTITVGFSYLINFNDGRTKLTNGFEYSQLRFDYKNWDFGPRINEAHEVSYSGVLEHDFSKDWAMMVIATPSLASDFEGTISSDDVMLETAIVGIYNFSQRFSLGLGCGYNPRLGQHNLMPVLGIRWNNGSNMKAEAILPNSVSFAYRPNPIMDVGLQAGLDGAQYHGDPDKFGVDKPYLRYSVAKVGPNIEFHFFQFVHLNIETGYTFHRRFEFYDGNDKQSSYDLEQSYYVQAQLRIGP